MATKVKEEFVLPTRRVQTAEAASQRWNVTLPVGVPFKALLRPAAWAQVAHRFKADPLSGLRSRVNDIIEVRTEDSRFYGELYVMAVRDQSLYVAVLREPVDLKVAETEKEKFQMRWNVGTQGYDIIRQSDKAIVGSAATREDAVSKIESLAA